MTRRRKRNSHFGRRDGKKKIAVSVSPHLGEQKKKSQDPSSLSLGVGSRESTDNELIPDLMPRRWDSDSDDDASVDSSWSSSICDDSSVDDIIPSESDDYDDASSFSSSDTNSAQTTADRIKNLNHATIDLLDVEDLSFLQRTILDFCNDRWDHKRISWDAHVAQLEHEGMFSNEYLMTKRTHQKCVSIVAPYIQRAEFNSRCSEPILVEHIVAVGLRVLSGGRTKDQRHITGMSLDAAYKAADDYIDAVNAAPEFDICMPKTDDEWEAINRGFKGKSTNEIIAGCVGALDGFFQRTNKPSQKEAFNVLAYYSGHYESYGVNCQACVNSNLEFMYFGVVSPGSMNNNISYPMAPGLKEVLDALLLGRYAVADAAYTLSESILIPFTGSDRLDKAQDSFNYYLSQLRIRVEMAFGRLVNKFRILSGKINGSLDRVTRILMACARLHNFIIREDRPFDKHYRTVEEEIDGMNLSPDPNAPLEMSYLPVVPDDMFEVYLGVSHTREAIVEFLRENDILRPVHNVERKKRELAASNTALTVHSPNGMEWDREYVSPL